MENRMNKKELLKLLKTLKLNEEEFYIIASGALVLRGICEDAGDLDLVVTKKGLRELKQNYNMFYRKSGVYTVTEKIECECQKINKNKLDKIDGYYVQNINEYLNEIEQSTREKERKIIQLVRNYINK